jgi:iron complex transport system substrate-binding protein
MKRLLFSFLLWGSSLARAAAPERIVSLLPSHTEILSVLGILDRVVGVSDAEDARLLPNVPRVGGVDIVWEVLAAQRPDLILADSSHRRYDDLFRRLHLSVVYLPSTDARTVEQVFDLIQAVGRLTGREDAARRWVNRARVRAKALDARRLPGPGPRVYFEIWPQPLQACGPGSLPGHLLSRVGAQNVVPDTGQDMPLVSAEVVVRADPEIILHTGVTPAAEIAHRPGWSSVSAVKTMRIIGVNQNDFSRAGPRVLDAWEALLNLLGAP